MIIDCTLCGNGLTHGDKGYCSAACRNTHLRGYRIRRRARRAVGSARAFTTPNEGEATS